MAPRLLYDQLHMNAARPPEIPVNQARGSWGRCGRHVRSGAGAAVAQPEPYPAGELIYTLTNSSRPLHGPAGA
ncbi:hypothetical protein AOLI_G00086170 [Acnodon oligacanthus]